MKRKEYYATGRIVIWVIAAHLVVVLTLLIVPWLRRRFRTPPPQIIPIELSMYMAAAPAPEPVPMADPTTTAPEPAPETESAVTTNRPVADPVPEPDPEPVRKRPRIEVSEERVVRRRDTTPAPETQPALTADALRNLLTDTLASETTSARITPSDEQRDLELIRQTLHQAWRQPSGHHLRGRVTVVSLRLNSQGTILEHTIDRSSGDPAMDASVRAAMDAVNRVPGLSSGFATRRPRVTIYFELAD